MIKTPTQQSRLAYGQTELIHTIRRCGLTSGLKLCLDAGDANSYSSGQSWLDTSGNGYDFFRGATSGSEASDPTFNGTAGQRSSGEYWSFDGGDYFRYDSANETWMNNLHKDNAKFTLLAWTRFPDLTGSTGMFGACNDASQVGVFLFLSGFEEVVFDVANGGGGLACTFSSGSLSIDTWHMIAVSLDEAIGANGAILYVDGAGTTPTSTYTTPSAAAATYTYEIAALGNANFPIVNTSRLGMFAAWEGVALTQSQLNALYMHTRGRYGV